MLEILLAYAETNFGQGERESKGYSTEVEGSIPSICAALLATATD